MSKPYLCVFCRLRSVTSNNAFRSFKRHRQFSESARVKQEDQIESSVSDVFPGAAQLKQSGTVSRRATTLDSRGRPHKPSQSVRRGRYSGKALRPEQLLDELGDDPYIGHQEEHRRHPKTDSKERNGRDRANRAHTNNGEAQGFEERTQTFDLPPKFVRKAENFIAHAKMHNDDRGARWHNEFQWPLLKDLLGYNDSAILQTLVLDQPFTRAFFFWTQSTCQYWLDDLKHGERSGTQSSSEAYPLRPSVVLKLAQYLAKERADLWRMQLLWRTAWNVAETQAAAVSNEEEPPDSAIEGFGELIRMWFLCAAVKAQQEGDETTRSQMSLRQLLAPSQVHWTVLPSTASFQEKLLRRQQTTRNGSIFDQALDLFLPKPHRFAPHISRQLASGHDLYDYPSAILVTLGLWRIIESKRPENPDVLHARPFMEFVEAILRSVDVKHLPLALEQRMSRAEDTNTRKFYEGLVDQIGLSRKEKHEEFVRLSDNTSSVKSASTNAHDSPGLHGVPSGLISSLPTQEEPATAINDASPVGQFAKNAIKRLGRALEQQDLRYAEAILRDLRKFLHENQDATIPMVVYEHFMLVLLSLRSKSTAIDVWNEMIRAGHQPTSKTYTVMMRGSQNVRNTADMESFWKKMREAGMQPDSHSWSVRIFGLFRGRQTDAGMQALKKMAQEWIAAAAVADNRGRGNTGRKSNTELQPAELLAKYNGDIEGVPRPDIVVMNSAVSAVAAVNDQLVPKILAWGRPFGIEPNLTTYNALLNITMRHGLATEALNILNRMREKNIEADSTTWTVLLAAMFQSGFINDSDPEEQTSRVLDFIKSLETANAAAIDHRGYAYAIDKLLKVYNNPPAAQAILQHMSRRGVEPQKQIYTILMDSYFQQSPPDLAAVESLWAYMQTLSGQYRLTLDSVFYDRIIEGYATHHAAIGVKPMLQFLARTETEGKKPSWTALLAVIKALDESRQWDRLAQIVDTVRQRRAGAKSGGMRFGERDFWEYAIQTGVLKHEGISHVDQMLQQE